MINDHRKRDTEDPIVWIVATDKVLSGWGLAPIASYVAYPAYDYEDIKAIKAFCEKKPEYIRVRENLNLPRVNKAGYHLSVYDRPYTTD